MEIDQRNRNGSSHCHKRLDLQSLIIHLRETCLLDRHHLLEEPHMNNHWLLHIHDISTQSLNGILIIERKEIQDGINHPNPDGMVVNVKKKKGAARQDSGSKVRDGQSLDRTGASQGNHKPKRNQGNVPWHEQQQRWNYPTEQPRWDQSTQRSWRDTQARGDPTPDPAQQWADQSNWQPSTQQDTREAYIDQGHQLNSKPLCRRKAACHHLHLHHKRCNHHRALVEEIDK